MTKQQIKSLQNGLWQVFLKSFILRSFNNVFICRVKDEVLNFSMSMRQEEDDEKCILDKTRIPSYFYSSFFMSKLLEEGYCYANVKRYFEFFKFKIVYFQHYYF